MTLAYVLAALDPPDIGEPSRYTRSERASSVSPTDGALSDDTLLERLRAGDTTAFDALYHRYYHGLWRFVFGYVRSPDIAEELVQDIFLSVWTRRETLVVRAGVEAYLYGAARNRALRARTQDARIARVNAAAISAGDALTTGAPPQNAAEALDVRELRAAVTRAVASLPEARRTVLVLRWTRQMSYPAIAAIMNTTEDAARMQVKRAEQQLAEILRDYGTELTLP